MQVNENRKKLISMLIIFFLLSFNMSLLWNLKDSLIITTAGAEIIPFIKVWVLLPATLILTFLYTFLSNRLSQEKVFYLLTSFFLIFYALFITLLYPYRDQLHPEDSAIYLENLLPTGFKGLISVYHYWTFTLFYVMSELWSTILIYLLFWGFANQITQINEAKRSYSLLSIAYNITPIAAGGISLAIAEETWEPTFNLLMIVIIVSGLLTMVTFRWMHKNVPFTRITFDKKISLTESFKCITKSKALICIAGIVLGYNLVINLTEIVWKDQLKNLYPHTLDYNNYISYLQIAQGVVALFISLILSKLITQHGWTKTALITPILMLLLCLSFFGTLFLQFPLTLVVIMGAIHNFMSKASKYTLFDCTKEMAFIPFSPETKHKGKIAIDGVGSRLGKSGGSFIHQSLLILLASIGASAPYVAGIVLIVLLIWIASVYSLGKLIKVA